MEIWRNIPGYEGLYQVSNEGNAKSLDRDVVYKDGRIRHHKGKLLIPVVLENGYLFVNLYKNGKVKHKTIHRLVAETFLPNPLNLPQVNHKDENKINNRVENLEWCTHEYNHNYGTHNQRSAEGRSKKVYQYTLDGRLVKIWPSVAECGRNGFHHSAVVNCCLGKRKTHKGFRWSYVPL